MNTLRTHSPCIGVCQINDGACIGCGRTLEEISTWRARTDAEKDRWWRQWAEKTKDVQRVLDGVGSEDRPK